MAKSPTNKTQKKRISKINLKLTSSQRLVTGSFFTIIGILLFIALLSYLFTGENDQSTLNDFTNRATQTENWLSKIGAWVSELLIYNGFGVFSFIFSGVVFSVCIQNPSGTPVSELTTGSYGCSQNKTGSLDNSLTASSGVKVAK